ncbi:O-antigen polymerase [Alkalihalobacillus sp. FSL W8-0930]
MKNPFYIYIYAFVLVIVVYQFNWSNKFPELSSGLILFLLFTFIASFAVGKFVEKNKLIQFEKLYIKNDRSLHTLTIIIYAGYLIEFIYHRTIPLIDLFREGGIVYAEFGIPTFHVILVTFHSFVSITVFHLWLSDKKKYYAYIFLLLLIPSVLIFNRGMIIMILICCTYIFILSLKRMKFKNLISLICLALLGLYIFGLMGNLRVNDAYGVEEDPFKSSLIMSIGGADSKFESSIIPNSFFWGYIYISSPLANFQSTVNESSNSNNDIKIKDFISWYNNEILYDFIGKRLADEYRIERPDVVQISPELNVGTVYSRSYIYLEWLGPLLTFSFLILSSFIYIIVLRSIKSPFFLIAVSIYSTIFLFNTFSNMINFSGLSFQLAYPLILTFIPSFKGLFYVR